MSKAAAGKTTKKANRSAPGEGPVKVLLAEDEESFIEALVIGLTLGFLLWLTMLRYLIRGVIAANRGEEFEVPSWICARIVGLLTR